ncbi:MAG: MFS transporter [Chloroflexota bacterium]
MNIFHGIRQLRADVRKLNRSAWLLLIATVMDGLIFSAWSLFFNFYILQRGFDRQFLGLANAMPSVGALLLGIPIGVLSDRLGRKQSMMLGLMISTSGLLLQVIIPQPILILMAGFLGGLGNMLFFVSQAPLMMKISDDETRTLLFSLNYGLFTLSGAVGSLFAGQLPAIFADWMKVAADSASAYQAVLVSAAVISYGTLVPLILLKEPRVLGQSKMAAVSIREILKVLVQKLTFKLSLPNLLIGLGAAILIPYMNVFLRERYSISDQWLGALFSMSALLTGLASIIVPRLSNSLGGKIRSVVITQAVSVIFLLVLGFSPFLWLSSLAFLVRATLMNMANPLYHAFAMEQIPEERQGAVNSVMELSWQFGWSVGPYLSGIVQAQYGFTPLFLATALIYSFSTMLVWINFRGKESPAMSAIALEP